MELVYINTAARELVPGEWFGKRCFEVLPIVDEACTFHCPKIRAVNESVDVVYCEETVFAGNNDRRVFGVGLIPLGPGSDDHAAPFSCCVPRENPSKKARSARSC
jgi:hypothetical protein